MVSVLGSGCVLGLIGSTVSCSTSSLGSWCIGSSPISPASPVSPFEIFSEMGSKFGVWSVTMR